MDTQPVKAVRKNPIPNIEERNHECFIVSSKNDDCISNNKK